MTSGTICIKKNIKDIVLLMFSKVDCILYFCSLIDCNIYIRGK